MDKVLSLLVDRAMNLSVEPTDVTTEFICMLFSGYGGTGRRARLRIWFRKEFGFESHYPDINTRPQLQLCDCWRC